MADTAAIVRDHGPAIIALARASVAHGLAHQQALPVDPAAHPEALRATLACFVTLQAAGDLRGCIGSIQASRALALDVAGHAFDAAFRDPRFPPVTAEEAPGLDYHVSILSPMQPLAVSGEMDLLARLRPGVDGLLIEDGFHRATFLPSVWESLPDPADFLARLLRKAGLRPGHWSPTFKVSRYTTEVVHS